MATADMTDNAEEEFLNRWFPELDTTSYIIPVTHLDHTHTDLTDVPTGAIKHKDDSRLSTAQTIKEMDTVQNFAPALFTKLKDHTAREEVMVMMTQASFSMYSNIVTAASASVSRTKEVSLKDIVNQKQKHSDLVIVNKQRGILVGVIQGVHFADPSLARQKLEETVTYLTKAARFVQEVVRTVPGADNVAVHTTLVLPNITREQVEEHRQFQQAVQGMPCLCKDQMINNDDVDRWWEVCWSSHHLDFMDSDVYRHLVARFAIPATRVEIFLTTQPRLQLKHEHDVVNAVGDVHGAEVFQAGLHQLSLFPTQAKLLDFDYLDESHDDVKFLWGPPGTGKTILLVLRALQWVKHFSARHIFILQTSYDGTAASCLVEYQLQQTLNAQQQRAQQSDTDTQSAQCTFTHVDMSGLWKYTKNKATGRLEVLVNERLKEKLSPELDLQQRNQSDISIYILADTANGDIMAAVYQWLKKKGVTTVRLWAAGDEAFWDKEKISVSLQNALCHVTEPLRCPGPVVQEVMKAKQIEDGDVPRYDMGWQLTGEPPVEQLQHDMGCDGHTGFYPWHCGQCGKNIAAKLKSLHVGEVDEGRHKLSANDVFILGSDILCHGPDDHIMSPAPLINCLKDNGYNVRTLSSTSARDDVMAVVKRDVQPPAVTVAEESCVRGLERKIVIFCGGYVKNAFWTNSLLALSRTTSLLICIQSRAELLREKLFDAGTADIHSSIPVLPRAYHPLYQQDVMLSPSAKAQQVCLKEKMGALLGESSEADIYAIGKFRKSLLPKRPTSSVDALWSEGPTKVHEQEQKDMQDREVLMTASFSDNNQGISKDIGEDSYLCWRCKSDKSYSDSPDSRNQMAMCQEFHETVVKTLKDSMRRPLLSQDWQTQSEFTEEGGRLCKPGSEVVLIVQPGAVKTGTTVTIYSAICVDLDLMYSQLNLTRENAIIVSPFVEYWTADNLKFEIPVCIILPHFLPEDVNLESVKVYYVKQDDNDITLTEVPNSLEEGFDFWYQYDSETMKLQVFTYHFSSFFCSYCSKDKRYHKKLPQLFFRGKGTIVDCIERQHVHVDAYIWDDRIKVPEFTKDPVIQNLSHHSLQIEITGKLQDSKVLFQLVKGTGLGELKHSLRDGSNTPIYQEQQDLELYRWIGCNNCFQNKEFPYKQLQWHLEYPPGHSPVSSLILFVEAMQCDIPGKKSILKLDVKKEQVHVSSLLASSSEQQQGNVHPLRELLNQPIVEKTFQYIDKNIILMVAENLGDNGTLNYFLDLGLPFTQYTNLVDQFKKLQERHLVCLMAWCNRNQSRNALCDLKKSLIKCERKDIYDEIEKYEAANKTQE